MLLPADLRLRLRLGPGVRLAARIDGDRLILEPPAAVLRRLQERFAAIPATVSLVDELLADRRREMRASVA